MIDKEKPTVPEPGTTQVFEVPILEIEIRVKDEKCEKQ